MTVSGFLMIVRVMAEILALGLGVGFFSPAVFVGRILQTIRLVFSMPLNVICFPLCPSDRD